jgi:transposase
VQKIRFKRYVVTVQIRTFKDTKGQNMSYKQGVNRQQINLFPISLDAAIAEDNVVRVIDAFVNWLDLEKLGFLHTSDNLLGTSMYPPSMLLKLYLYGYLNRIRSSRRLELECTRNIELHWLLHRMTPGYHTIADFRKNNPQALKGVFKEFTQFCITMSLVEGETIAFDGTRIHAQNSQKNNFNAKRLENLLSRIDTKMGQYEEYLKALDEQDKVETSETQMIVPVGKTKESVEKTLALLEERRIQYQAFAEQLKTASEQGCPTEDLQISTVDPDARAMIFKKSHTEVGYNIQTAGDAKNKLIIHFDVTNVNDNNALSDLALATKDILHKKDEESYNALADTGYHNGKELTICEQANIKTFVCPDDINKAKSQLKSDSANPFSKDKFIYDALSDTYTCPNDQKLKTNGTWYTSKVNSTSRLERQTKQYTLPMSICKACPFSEQCQGNAVKHNRGRTIHRTPFDDAILINRKRVLQNPDAYKQRKEIIEHPFGTIKRSWGFNYTLLKTKKKVAGEFALIYCAYNIRRVISILGVNELIKALNNQNSILLYYFMALRAIFLNAYQISHAFKRSPHPVYLPHRL